MTATPRVSILLVTRDGMSTLPAVLDAIARQRVSPEGQEGLRAFLDKRPARWTLDPGAGPKPPRSSS